MPFNRNYSDEQREALIEARIERKLSGRAIADLAEQGALTHRGKVLPPFKIPTNTVYTLTADHHRRTAKKGYQEPYMDRIARLQDRALSAAEYELVGYEKDAKKGKRNPEQLRQIIRVLREAKAMGDPEDRRRIKPGAHHPEAGKQVDSATQGGLGASILASARKGYEEEEAETAQELLPLDAGAEENSTHEATTHSTSSKEEPTTQHARTSLTRSIGMRLPAVAQTGTGVGSEPRQGADVA